MAPRLTSPERDNSTLWSLFPSPEILGRTLNSAGVRCPLSQPWVPREQEPKERAARGWTLCWQRLERLFCKRWGTSTPFNCLWAQGGEVLHSPLWASVFSSEVLRFRWCHGGQCTCTVFRFYTCTFISSTVAPALRILTHHPGFPSLWITDLLREQRGAQSYFKRLGQRSICILYWK